MEIIGLSVVATFVSLLLLGAVAVQMQHPPVEERQTICPEEGSSARVQLMWDAEAKAVAVAGCNHTRFRMNQCRQVCLSSLQQLIRVQPSPHYS